MYNSTETEITTKIFYYKNKINIIDKKVIAYLLNRKNNPYPRHESFIHEIRAFENKTHSLPYKNIKFLLNNLMDKLLIYEKRWNAAFKKDEDLYKKHS